MYRSIFVYIFISPSNNGFEYVLPVLKLKSLPQYELLCLLTYKSRLELQTFLHTMLLKSKKS